MIDFVTMKELFPYLYLFPIFLIILYIFFYIKSKKITNSRLSFFGMFMGLNNKDVVSLTLLLTYYYLIVASIFINTFSPIFCIVLIVIILLFEILNFNFIYFIADIVNTGIIMFILYIKTIFYYYMIDIEVFWYVLLLYVLVCTFIYFYATLIFIRRFRTMVGKNKYVKKTKIKAA